MKVVMVNTYSILINNILKFIKTDFNGLYIIIPEVHCDERGSFSEIYNKLLLSNLLGYDIDFCQDNKVESTKMVLRGLHLQAEPYSQTKLVSVSTGKIFDVVVDVRAGSKTYGKYFTIELDSKTKKILLVPKGFAHGYLTLSEYAVVNYKVDNYYNKESEIGIRYDDKHLDIDWGFDNSKFIISKKDKTLKDFDW